MPGLRHLPVASRSGLFWLCSRTCLRFLLPYTSYPKVQPGSQVLWLIGNQSQRMHAVSYFPGEDIQSPVLARSSKMPQCCQTLKSDSCVRCTVSKSLKHQVWSRESFITGRAANEKAGDWSQTCLVLLSPGTLYVWSAMYVEVGEGPGKASKVLEIICYFWHPSTLWGSWFLTCQPHVWYGSCKIDIINGIPALVPVIYCRKKSRRTGLIILARWWRNVPVCSTWSYYGERAQERFKWMKKHRPRLSRLECLCTRTAVNLATCPCITSHSILLSSPWCLTLVPGFTCPANRQTTCPADFVSVLAYRGTLPKTPMVYPVQKLLV